MQAAPAEAGEGAGEEGEGGAAAEEEEDYSMSPEDLERRLGALRESATFTVFDFTRRGLFDRDKLIVTCLLTLQVYPQKTCSFILLLMLHVRPRSSCIHRHNVKKSMINSPRNKQPLQNKQTQGNQGCNVLQELHMTGDSPRNVHM